MNWSPRSSITRFCPYVPFALSDRFGVSFWDALIVDAASQADAGVLYSEDLNDGQQVGSVRVANPFLS